MTTAEEFSDFDIAVIGMAGRFPKAPDLETFWRNLVDGTDCITWFSREELEEAGVEAELLDNPNFVPAAPVLEKADHFDAPFFGYSPKEARSIDPQQRHLLECGWLAIENAGYCPATFDGRIGVFAGTAMNTYFINTGLSSQFNVDYLPTLLGNDKDFLATRVAYKLGLQGPALTVQTACSTSIVAIHYASQSLLSGESDMALVAAAAVRVPLVTGHLYEEASVFTPDGKCRAFDADAAGTIFGSGAGAVMLKLAKNAARDGDNIRAIIRGSALNNDGQEKADFTAPSVSMQAAAIGEAMAAADVTADSIDYVEAHGTGTALGDPIEVAALTQAYSAETDQVGYCRIGSVKSNVGHLDAAAGMVALIKVVLSLENELIPRTLHYEKPNPQIDFASTPFMPAAENSAWARGDRPRRAGITSLGMGGTNAHLIVEEAPLPTPTAAENGPEPTLVLSARTTDDLDRLSESIGQHLEAHPDLAIADVAYALSRRSQFPEQRAILATDRAGMIEALTTKAHPLCADVAPGEPGEVVFVFTGQGAQRPGMGQGLYEADETFRSTVDRCAEMFQEHIGVDIRAEMWPDADDTSIAAERLAETWLTQPTLFTIGYALATWWTTNGVVPAAMIGHSIGELTAATVAGVMSLDDAVRLVSVRAKSMFEAERGTMIAVEATESDVASLLGDGIELAVQNGTESLVLAGPDDAVANLQRTLDQREIPYRELKTSHAFHTASMDAAADRVAEESATISFATPSIPVISDVHGGFWNEADQANDQYWGDQLRKTVRFSDGLETLLADGPRAFIELGPASTLTGLVANHPSRKRHHHVRSALPARIGSADEELHIRSTKRWLSVTGIMPDAETDTTGSQRMVDIPGYPFAGERYWYERPASELDETSLSAADLRSDDVDEWLHSETFAPVAGNVVLAEEEQRVLVLGELANLPDSAADWLSTIGPIDTAEPDGERWTSDAFTETLNALDEREQLPRRIVVPWNGDEPTESAVELIAIARSLARWDLSDDIDLAVVTDGLFDPLGAGSADPTGALALGVARTVAQEMETVTARVVDVGPEANEAAFVSAMLAGDSVAHAVQHKHRWIPLYTGTDLRQVAARRRRRVALIGGFGGIGMELARHFVDSGDIIGLTSTRPLDDSHRDAVGSLAGEVHPMTLALTDESGVTSGIKELAERLGGLDIIVHLGGRMNNGLLATKAPDIARAVLEPKVEGTTYLFAAAEAVGAELVLLSSIVATHPEAGHVDYSAATAFQQAVATSHPGARSIAYPAWTGTGMTNLLGEADQAKARASGIDPSDAVELFERFLGSSQASVIVSPIPLAHLDLARSGLVGSGPAKKRRPSSTPTESVEGLTDTEQRISRIWNQLLGHDQIAPTDRFPDLGGTSLLAVKMFTQIDREFGIELPVETVLEAPSLGELAGVLDDRLAAASNGKSANGSEASPPLAPKALVRVRPADGTPLFLVHAHGGTVLSYERLAQHIRDDVDVVGFQSFGIDGVTEPITEIDEMARIYIDEMKQYQPDGPYNLGGFCMGGTIAWEMAAQLTDAGEAVNSLFLIQSFNRDYPQYPDDEAGGRFLRAARDQMSLARLDDGGDGDSGGGAMAKAGALARGVKSKGYTTLMRLAEPVSSGRRSILTKIGRINDEAFWAYEPSRLHIPVAYMPATIQPEGAIEDPTLGFGRYHDGPSTIRAVSGHFSGRFVEMDLEAIAEEINARV